MNTEYFSNASKLMDEARRTGYRIAAYRPSTHLKGEKILLDIRYGDPIPPGVISWQGHAYLPYRIKLEEFNLEISVEQTHPKIAFWAFIQCCFFGFAR